MSYREVDAPRLLIAAFGGRVFAVDVQTGARVWSWDAGERLPVRLHVTRERVVVCAAGVLACLGYRSGEVLWRMALQSDTLLVVDDVVVTGGSGEVSAFALATGARLWHDGFEGMGLGLVALGVPGQVVQADS